MFLILKLLSLQLFVLMILHYIMCELLEQLKF